MTIALYPGSFDPVTRGHMDIVERAASLFEQVIMAVAINPNKPKAFEAIERQRLVEQSVKHLPNVSVTHYEGLTVEFAKTCGATVMIRGLRAVSDFEYECAMSQMNRTLHPELQTVFLMAGLEYQFLSSRMAREVALLGGDVSKLVEPHVEAALKATCNRK